MSEKKEKNTEWEDWHWQLRNSLRNRCGLQAALELSPEECAAFESHGQLAPPFALTPYYLSVIRAAPALRRTVIPFVSDWPAGAESELRDPLGEEAHSPLPGLVHTYPDKVLLLAGTSCATYCRYCTRGRMSGRLQVFDTEARIEYIRAHPAIRDVLVSGGDPLMLEDAELDDLLARIRSVPHVRTVRVGSKIPAVLPMRITDALAQMLARRGVWASLHFIHPAEITDETANACRRLAATGVPMLSQTVLLRGVNDSEEVLTELFYRLLEIKVKPYYLLQCDPVRGSAPFRTPVAEGVRLIRALHGRLSGAAVPQYVIDAPGGGGKIPLLCEEQFRRDGTDIVLRNHEGREFRYPDLPAC